MSSLYRKYRPSNFSEVIGQTHIVRTLSNAVKNNRIGHAYLLTGPRGTGKTTLARIFAKTINCLEPKIDEKNNAGLEPCNQCTNCKLIQDNRAMDLIEIDAASNTGVDNIRQLKETVALPPTALKYKVYIIDEVHMLSIGAFNALLKTLEEPPAHAVFILATTELHKVPETIISRCQRFDFSRLNQDQIIERLKQLAQLEKVEIDQEALETIALEAEGGMRDAESLLGQIIALEDKKITSTEVNQILGTSSKLLAIDFIELLAEQKTKEALEKITRLQADGVNLKNFNKNILVYLRSLLILSANPQATHLVSNLTSEQIERAQSIVAKIELKDLLQLVDLFQKSLLGFKTSPIPQLPLELAVIEYHVFKGGSSAIPVMPATPPAPTQPTTPQPTQPVTAPNNSLASTTNNSRVPHPSGIDSSPAQPAESQPTTPTESKAEAPATEDNNIAIEQYNNESATDASPTEESQLAPNTNITIEMILDKWAEILEGVKPLNHSIHAFLKNCVPAGMIGNQLYIKAKYDFYKDKLNEPNNRLTVSQVIAKIMQGDLKVTFATEKDCENLDFSQNKPDEQNHNILHDAMQMLGGKIVS